MPTKLGNGGYGQENYDDKTGRYLDSYETKVLENMGISKSKKWDSRNALPKMTSKSEPRKFYWEKDKNERKRIKERYFEIFGETLRIIDEKSKIPTSSDNSYERLTFRTNAVQDEIEKQKKERKINNEFKATIVLGLPGSGKSTITDRLLIENGAFEIDADNMKQRIPEFQQDSQNVSKVHDESVQMSEMMLNDVINQGSNIVIGKVGGGNPKSLISLAEKLHENGYNIDVIFNDLPMEIAIERTAERFKRGETTRIIPFHVFTGSDGKIDKNYDILMNMPFIKSGKIYSNDVPKNTSPKLLREDKK